MGAENESVGAETPQAASGETPWSADLSERFEDEAVRGQVDSYLREKWQPRMTQLEQQVAESGDAVRLWNDFRENPEQTLMAAAGELYGAENLTHFEKALRGVYGIEEQQAAEDALETVAEENPEQAQQAELPEWMVQEVQLSQAERQDREWTAAVKDVSEKQPELFPFESIEDKKAALAPFVINADGDMDAALQSYTAWFNQIRGGQISPQQAADLEQSGISADDIATPAPVGTDGAAHPTTPVVPNYANIGDAIADWAREERASKAPPPVGGV